MKAKVLVTGGAGYIGSHVVKLLNQNDFKVVVVDDLSTGHKEAVIAGELYVGNIGDKSFIQSVFDKHPDIEGIFHFAGSIIVPESVERPIEYYQNNFCNSVSFLDKCVENKVGNFIFSSTAAVYGETKKKFCDETDLLEPINPYGRSKLMMEWLLQDLSALNKIKYVALRYFNVAGASFDKDLGQRSKVSSHLIKLASEVACGKRDKLYIFGDDYLTEDGTCIRDYIHVEDLAQAHLDAYIYLKKGGQNQALNCGYGHGASVKEVIHALKEESKVNFAVETTSRRPGDSPVLVANNKKIKEELNWSPKYDDLNKIVRTAYEWEKTLS